MRDRCRALLFRILTQQGYRIRLLLLLSIIFNALYSLFLIVAWSIYSSDLLLLTALYQFGLCALRLWLLMLLWKAKTLREQLRGARRLGIYLLFLNVIIALMLNILTAEGRGVIYHKIVVIAIAAYTFTSLTVAILNTVRYFRSSEYLYFSAKLLGLVGAAVSMVTLTDTMLFAFGGGGVLRAIVMPSLSACVAVFIILCAIFMIKNVNSNLRVLENEQR